MRFFDSLPTADIISETSLTSSSSSNIVVVMMAVAPVVGVLPVVGVVLMGRDPSLRILLLKKRIINLSFSGQLAYLSGNFTYIPLKKCLFFFTFIILFCLHPGLHALRRYWPG